MKIKMNLVTWIVKRVGGKEKNASNEILKKNFKFKSFMRVVKARVAHMCAADPRERRATFACAGAISISLFNGRICHFHWLYYYYTA